MRWVFLRGLVRERRHWGAFAERFRKEMGIAQDELIFVDFPGIGTETGRLFPLDMDALVEDARARAGLKSREKVGLFSMSLGSMCALAWAAKWPSEIDRLVVINTSASDLSSWHERLSLTAMRGVARILRAKDELARESVILELTSNLRADDPKLPSDWAAYAPAKSEMIPLALRQLWVAARFKAPERLDVPTLVLSSAGDNFVNPACSERLARYLGVENHVHPSAGHDLVLDDPDWVIRRLEEWTERLRRRP